MTTLDDAVARAGRAWLLASGLAAEVDTVRHHENDVPIPAPGLDALVDQAAASSLEACEAADLVARLREELSTADDDSGDETESRARDAVQRVHAAAEAAERAARSVGQLALGVSSLAALSDRTDRLDRVGVALLHPPPGYGPAIGLLEDGTKIRARFAQELTVEVAGLLCRLLIDRGVVIEFGCATGAITFSVDPWDTLRASATVEHDIAEQSGSALLELGWEPGTAGGGLHKTWQSPVTIAEPAQLTVKSLCGALPLTDLSSLTARLTADAQPGH
jgi:hypothetical protein